MIHETEVNKLGPSHFQMVCSCGEQQRSLSVTRADAEGWAYEHHHRVKFVLLNHGPRKPSIKTLRKYYEEQADSLSNTIADRKLWKQMADELKRYLDDHDANGEQLPLF